MTREEFYTKLGLSSSDIEILNILDTLPPVISFQVHCSEIFISKEVVTASIFNPDVRDILIKELLYSLTGNISEDTIQRTDIQETIDHLVHKQMLMIDKDDFDSYNELEEDINKLANTIGVQHGSIMRLNHQQFLKKRRIENLKKGNN